MGIMDNLAKAKQIAAEHEAGLLMKIFGNKRLIITIGYQNLQFTFEVTGSVHARIGDPLPEPVVEAYLENKE